MSAPKELETLMLLNAANPQGDVQVVVPEKMYTMYSNNVQFERAVVKLQKLPDVIKSSNRDSMT